MFSGFDNLKVIGSLRAVLAELCQESQNAVGGILNFGLHLSLKTFSELGCEGEPRKSA